MRIRPGPAVFAAALLIRLAYLAELYPTPLAAVLTGDGVVYDEWARRIAAGDWIGTEVFYQAPLYPYFLAVVYKLFGPAPWAVRVVQAVIDALSCALLTAAGRRFFSPAVGTVAGAMLACYGPMIFFVGLLQKPVLDVALLCLLLLLIGEAQRRPRARLLALAGATAGLLALTRENALVLLPVLLVWIAARFRELPAARRAAWAAAALAGAALVLVPVGLRNRRIGGAFLLTTAQMGPNLYIGNGPAADGSYVPLRFDRAHPRFEQADAREIAEAAAGRPLTPAEVSRYWLRRTLDHVRSRPGAWARLTWKKWRMVWNDREFLDFEAIEAYREWSVVLAACSLVVRFGTLAPLALAGVWLSRKRLRECGVLAAVLVALAWSVTAFYVLGRYRAALVPALALFAGAGAVHLATARGGRRGALACVALGAVASNWPLPAAWDPRAVTYQNLGAEHLALARSAEARGDRAGRDRAYRDAERLIKRVIALVQPGTPPAGDAHRLLGVALRAEGRIDEAIEEHRRALAVDPRLWVLEAGLAEMLASRGRVEEAIGHWRAATRQAPRSPDLRYTLGTVLLMTGRPGEAEEQLRIALELRPGWPEARLRLREAAAQRERAAAAAPATAGRSSRRRTSLP